MSPITYIKTKVIRITINFNRNQLLIKLILNEYLIEIMITIFTALNRS